MQIPGARAIPNWAHSHFWESSSLFWRWLLPYVSMLTLGVLGDVTYCKLTPFPPIWTQILPELHYDGIVFLATRFGAGAGFGAACLAGLLHTTAIAITCSEPSSQKGHLVMFAVVGIIAGLASKGRADSARTEAIPPADAESSRSFSLSELGRMMPEVMQQFLTPIASIQGAGYVLGDGDLSDDKRQEFVEIIRKECRRLEVLVELIDFTQSRFSAYEEPNVARLLEEIVDQCRTNTGSRIALRSVAPVDLPRLRCAPELIKYALQTLTTDAIRAIPQHGHVELSANSISGKIVIHIEARATPPGPPLDIALTRDQGGIDLAVVQQIVDRHRGSVRVDPNGGGASISMILPLKSG